MKLELGFDFFNWRFGSLGPVPAKPRYRPFFAYNKEIYEVRPQRDISGLIYRWRFALGPFQLRMRG